MVDMVYVKNNNTTRTKYIIKLLRGNNCFTIYLKEDSSENPRHEPSVVPNTENKHNTIVSSPTKHHVHEVTDIEGECTYE